MCVCLFIVVVLFLQLICPSNLQLLHKIFFTCIWHVFVFYPNKIIYWSGVLYPPRPVGWGWGFNASHWKSSSAPEITPACVLCAILHPLPWIVLTTWWRANVKKTLFLILDRKSVTRKQHDRSSHGHRPFRPHESKSRQTRSSEAVVSKDASKTGACVSRWVKNPAVSFHSALKFTSSLIFLSTFGKARTCESWGALRMKCRLWS